jgi:ATP-binding cassette, subfamily B, bacterial
VWLLIDGRAKGTITIGDFALIFALTAQIFECMWGVSNEVTRFTEHFGKITQGLRLTTQAHDIQDEPSAPALQVTKGEICFNKVHFQFSDVEPLFSNKSVVIRAGQKVGLVGYSGSGKSTFVNLILRVFELQSGEIRIDGQDISKVTQNSLRQVISMIPQDPALFHRTLFENIQYGKLDATQDEIIQAAKKAHAHAFITLLPAGYESLVGERGIKLSGGQRQRITIARAILKNAPILILDEATSALDSVTENLIQESLLELMQGKTTLVVAHRLSTLLYMDRILVFDKGKIVEDGTHDDLLSKNGRYKTLWDAQVGGFLPEKHADS